MNIERPFLGSVFSGFDEKHGLRIAGAKVFTLLVRAIDIQFLAETSSSLITDDKCIINYKRSTHRSGLIVRKNTAVLRLPQVLIILVLHIQRIFAVTSSHLYVLPTSSQVIMPAGFPLFIPYNNHDCAGPDLPRTTC